MTAPASVTLWLTDQADVRCAHRIGRSGQQASQGLVRVDGHPVLVGPDPQGRSISGCPNVGVAITPCNNTLRILRGESNFVRIDGSPVIRADLDGLTDGTPPGAVHYQVLSPGQRLVGEWP